MGMGALFWCMYAGWALWLSWHDVASRRLPDRLTLPAFPVAAAFSLDDAAFAAFLCGAAIWAVGYGAVGVVKPGAMGGGDVKLALTLGGVAGWHAGVPGTLTAMIAAGMLTALAGLAWRKRAMPHGPSMLLACAGVALGGPVE
ncbi:prepilin peptidase [Corynebacterium sp. NPDC060344]|uniref:prepilin peptidase n=1 Tax=Corynebacterium sp. NPDC060344 TaxID=3347101 RepID=UPI00365315D5